MGKCNNIRLDNHKHYSYDLTDLAELLTGLKGALDLSDNPENNPLSPPITDVPAFWMIENPGWINCNSKIVYFEQGDLLVYNPDKGEHNQVSYQRELPVLPQAGDTIRFDGNKWEIAPLRVLEGELTLKGVEGDSAFPDFKFLINPYELEIRGSNNGTRIIGINDDTMQLVLYGGLSRRNNYDGLTPIIDLLWDGDGNCANIRNVKILCLWDEARQFEGRIYLDDDIYYLSTANDDRACLDADRIFCSEIEPGRIKFPYIAKSGNLTSNEIDPERIAVHRDLNTNKYYLVFNTPEHGIKKVELT